MIAAAIVVLLLYSALAVIGGYFVIVTSPGFSLRDKFGTIWILSGFTTILIALLLRLIMEVI